METTNETISAKVNDIKSGKESLQSLDFTLAQDREVALKCIQDQRPLACQLDVTDEHQREVLKAWITHDYANLLALDVQQRHPELVAIYLFEKLNGRSSVVDNAHTYKSYDQQQVITYGYETKEGEAVCYFDKMLGVPTSLKVNALFKFKVTDALALVRAVDIEISRIDFRLVIGYITDKINDAIREVLLGVIDGQKLSYYELSRHYADISKNLGDMLNVQFVNSGLVTSDVRILNITIPNDTSKQLESQYFALAEMERVKERENALEEASLKLYEAKAAIHKKYPEYPVTLTEAEKDMALNRYLKRIGSSVQYSAKIKQDGLEQRQETGIGDDTLVKPVAPVAPQEPVGNKKWKILFIVAAVVVGVVGALIAGLASLVAGLVIIGIGAVAFTVLGIVKRKALKYGVSEAERALYNAKREQYVEDMAKYNAQLSAYNKRLAERVAQEEEQAKLAVAGNGDGSQNS